MHVIQFLIPLSRAPHVEVVESSLPKMGIAFQSVAGPKLQLPGRAFLFFPRSARDTRCFSAFITSDGFPTSGSLISK